MMSAEPLLPREERERIAEEAAERGENPAEYARTLLEKGRRFDTVSRSRDRLMDEIRRVQDGDREAGEITLPSDSHLDL